MQCVYLFIFNYSFTLAMTYLQRYFKMEHVLMSYIVSSWRHDYKQDIRLFSIYFINLFIVDYVILFPSNVLLFFW